MRRRFTAREELRAAELRHAGIERRHDRAQRDLVRDPFEPRFIVEAATVRAEYLASRADVAALRGAHELEVSLGRS